ncbi:hypothetical protein T10_7281 [Trichinella papuae]|uniref:Uncharacterized protein n=1 Tax=Trichinella papuae TaxID=268474 RepID=A0A0V1MFC5_9BILA|nr:hypothetical protein T10_7281 [Trichinella papuae]
MGYSASSTSGVLLNRPRAFNRSHSSRNGSSSSNLLFLDNLGVFIKELFLSRNVPSWIWSNQYLCALILLQQRWRFVIRLYDVLAAVVLPFLSERCDPHLANLPFIISFICRQFFNRTESQGVIRPVLIDAEGFPLHKPLQVRDGVLHEPSRVLASHCSTIFAQLGPISAIRVCRRRICSGEPPLRRQVVEMDMYSHLHIPAFLVDAELIHFLDISPVSRQPFNAFHLEAVNYRKRLDYSSLHMVGRVRNLSTRTGLVSDGLSASLADISALISSRRGRVTYCNVATEPYDPSPAITYNAGQINGSQIIITRRRLFTFTGER